MKNGVCRPLKSSRRMSGNSKGKGRLRGPSFCYWFQHPVWTQRANNRERFRDHPFLQSGATRSANGGKYCCRKQNQSTRKRGLPPPTQVKFTWFHDCSRIVNVYKRIETFLNVSFTTSSEKRRKLLSVGAGIYPPENLIYWPVLKKFTLLLLFFVFILEQIYILVKKSN